jgi:hypothetical protein
MELNNDWIQLYSGVKFYPLNAKSELIFIEDIAHSLSLQCRFNGHCEKFYSVAQHSVLVARKCPDEYKLWGLLHDASEAYLSDIISPIKNTILYEDIKKIDKALEKQILNEFNVQITDKGKKIVKSVDMRMLVTEKKWLMKNTYRWQCEDEYKPYDMIIKPWSAKKSAMEFTKLFNKLHARQT